MTLDMLCDIAMLLPRPNNTERNHWTVEYGGRDYEFKKFISAAGRTWWASPDTRALPEGRPKEGPRIFYATTGTIRIYINRRQWESSYNRDITGRYMKEGLTP